MHNSCTSQQTFNVFMDGGVSNRHSWIFVNFALINLVTTLFVLNAESTALKLPVLFSSLLPSPYKQPTHCTLLLFKLGPKNILKTESSHLKYPILTKTSTTLAFLHSGQTDATNLNHGILQQSACINVACFCSLSDKGRKNGFSPYS